MAAGKRLRAKLAELEKLLCELDDFVGNKFRCSECGLTVAQILLGHLTDAHDLEPSVHFEHRHGGEQNAAEEYPGDFNTSKEPLKLTLVNLIDLEDPEKEKGSICDALDDIQRNMPELTLESRMELQHSDGIDAQPRVDDDVTRSLNALECMLDNISQLYLENGTTDERFRLHEGGTEETRVFSAQDDGEASSWVEMMTLLRPPCPGKGDVSVAVEERVVALNEKYACDVCDLKFPKRSLLFRHVLRHSSVGLRRCGRCAKLSEIPGGKDECPECVSCLREEKKNKSCRILAEAVKPDAMPKKVVRRRFPCSRCNRKFATKLSVEIHEKMHDGKNVFECFRCSTVYTSLYLLTEHSKSHPEDEPYDVTGDALYSCRVCEKKFNKRANYLRHVDIHNGIRYCCKFCSRSYTQEYQLRCHERKHSGVPRFRCRVCDKTFVEPSTFSRHKKTHRSKRKPEETSREGPSSVDVTGGVKTLKSGVPAQRDSQPSPPPPPTTCVRTPAPRPAPAPAPPLPLQPQPILAPSRRAPRPIAPHPGRKEGSSEIEVILCKSVPSDKGKLTLVANSFRAERSGIPGYQSLTSSLIIEGGGSVGTVKAARGRDRPPVFPGKEQVEVKTVQVEVDGKIYPAFFL